MHGVQPAFSGIKKAQMENLLLKEPEYQVNETASGTWRRFLYPSGRLYSEFISRRRLFGLPLVHYTAGICPETGRRRVAKGVLALGRTAFGLIALGQAAFGLIAVGQAAFGLVFGLGQMAAGALAIGQVAVGGFSLGQVAVGVFAVGQLGVGLYVLAQRGFGGFIWDGRGVDPAAEDFFRGLLWRIGKRVG